MARDKGKSKFVHQSSSESPEGETPLVKLKKSSQGWDASKDVAASGSSGSAHAESGKQAGSSGERHLSLVSSTFY